jgi:hypothetical protein
MDFARAPHNRFEGWCCCVFSGRDCFRVGLVVAMMVAIVCLGLIGMLLQMWMPCLVLKN